MPCSERRWPSAPRERALASPGPLAAPGVVERLWHDFADLGPWEGHAIDIGAATAEVAADLVGRRLQGGLLAT